MRYLTVKVITYWKQNIPILGLVCVPCQCLLMKNFVLLRGKFYLQIQRRSIPGQDEMCITHTSRPMRETKPKLHVCRVCHRQKSCELWKFVSKTRHDRSCIKLWTRNARFYEIKEFRENDDFTTCTEQKSLRYLCLDDLIIVM